MQYINLSAVNRLQPDFSSPSFSIKYVLYFLYFARKHRSPKTLVDTGLTGNSPTPAGRGVAVKQNAPTGWWGR